MALTSAPSPSEQDAQYIEHRTVSDFEPAQSSDDQSWIASASQASTAETSASSHMNHASDKDSSQSSIEPISDDLSERKASDERGLTFSAVDPRWQHHGIPRLQIGIHSQVNSVERGYQDGFTVNEVRYGQKRTASGVVKAPVPSSVVSGLEYSQVERPKSLASPTQVNELSAQLRTRLSYAMLKVQNGWQSRNLRELESIASSKEPLVNQQHPRPWAQATIASYSSGNGPVLAPPVDFGVSNRSKQSKDRSSSTHSASPTLSNGRPATAAGYARYAHNKPSAQPATPPLSFSERALQNPTEGATASERDAIETLMFMSSPGNSQTFANLDRSVSQNSRSSNGNGFQTPHRGILASPNGQTNSKKHVAFQSRNVATAIEAGPGELILPRQKNLLDTAAFGTDESIDKVLDQMPTNGDDDYSSSDESTGSIVEPKDRLRSGASQT